MSQRIKVLIRPRALPKQQIKNYLSLDYHNNTISLQKHNQKSILSGVKDNTVRSFSFQKIFQEDNSQQQVYEQSAFSLVQNVLDGYNGTIFAYGQTGSGKTYTIMGAKQYMERRNLDKKVIKQENVHNMAEKVEGAYLNQVKGIIPRSFNQIITVINSRKDKKHLIQCSFIEIYNESVHDLLAEDTKIKLNLKQTPNKGLVIDGLNTFLVKSGQQLQKYLKIGYRNRSVRQTNMNKQSSRSHCIFNIKVQEQSTDQKGNLKFKVGKLNLVDLAGSERQNTLNNSIEGVKQTTKINLSLSALGKVINCLYNYRQNQKTHVPYRDSKLTRILQDSLGGNTKTIMIATISLSNSNYQQTLSTLIYASRAKFIQNKPIINEDPKDVLLRQYVQQIEKLKSLLMEKELQNEDLRKTTLIFKMSRTFRNEINTIDQIQQSKYIQDEQKNMLEQQGIKKKIYDLQQIFKKDEENQNEEQQKKELKKIEFLKMKIKLQQERQQQLQKQKKIKQKQLQYIEKNYNHLNQEVDTLRNKFTNLKEKYSAKKQQLSQIKKQYDEQKEDLAHLLKEKDKQIQQLQKILEGVIDNKSKRGNIKSNRSISQSDSQNSSRKIISHINIENKSKIKFNDSNLFKSLSTQKKAVSNQKQKVQQSLISKLTKQKNYVQGKNYQSEHEKKVNAPNTKKKTQTFTNLMKSESKYEIDKQILRKQSIKKVDSLISLKPLKRDSSLKLPFISEVKKLSAPKMKSEYNFGENQKVYFKQKSKEQMPAYTSSNSQNQKTEYASKISIDIAKIKQEIINELKNKGKQR